MEQKKTKIYLSYLDSHEKMKMTEALDFLRTGEKAGKEAFLKMADNLYGKGVKLEFAWDNGNYPGEWQAVNRTKDLHFYTVMQFERKDMSEQAIEALGENDSDSFDWRYFYGVALCSENRKMYAISYSNRCSPNWNQEYWAQQFITLEDIDFPLIQKHSLVYRMDDVLHAAVNSEMFKNEPLYAEKDGEVMVVVKDQHGNYTEIVGETIDVVFRDYADNYTGYRNYRRQMTSEWEIVDNAIRQRFEEWKKTANGLKSDFDKFYGGGIVD